MNTYLLSLRCAAWFAALALPPAALHAEQTSGDTPVDIAEDASTDSGPICTDRPTKSNAVCTVPKGAWQVEADGVKLAWRPTLKSEIGDEATAQTLFKLIDTLDDDDDVQTVWGNYEIPDAVMEKLG